MRLPSSPSLWPEEAIEEARERAALVWEGDASSTEADWPAAKEAAIRMVRRRWEQSGSHVHASAHPRAAHY